MNVPVLPAVGLEGLGVIDDPILRAAQGFHERAMADAPNVLGFPENRPAFLPGGRVEDIAGAVMEQAQAVIRRPTAAGGIDDENVAVALEDLGAFAYRHGDAFPALIRRAESNSRSGQGHGIAHGNGVKVLPPVARARPARPDEEHPAVVEGQHGAVDGPTAGLKLAAAMVLAARVVPFAFEDPHAMVVIVAVIGGVIDKPAIADAMQFRRPEVVAVPTRGGRVPDTNAGVLANAGNGPRTTDDDAALVVPALAVIVKALVVNHPGVRGMGWEYRVYTSAFRASELSNTDLDRSRAPPPGEPVLSPGFAGDARKLEFFSRASL